MKIKVKTVKGEQYEIDVDGSDKISAVKANIEKTHSLGDASAMKLIYAGKILTDEQSVAETSINENDFLVLMVSKVKPPSKPAPAEAETPRPEQPGAAAPAAAAAAPPPRPAERGALPAMLGGPSEETITQLCDMGFERSQVLAALNAAFGNAERAVEYLMTGIPEGASADAEMAAADGDAGGDEAGAGDAGAGGEGGDPAPLFNLRNVMGGGGEGGAPTGGGGADQSPLGALRQHPQFMQMVALIQQNPQLLQPLLQEIGQNNPQILQLINDHQQEFMELLQQPVSPEQAQFAQALAAGAGAGGAGGAPPPQNVIQVTPEEREAIGRLEALGFPRERVLEAYFACDKNEEIAANYLFDHGNDDDQ